MVEYSYIQFTYLLADFAAGAFFCIDAETVEGNRIEVPIQRTQGTQVAAEGSVYDDGKQNGHDKDQVFPSEKPANHFSEGFVARKQQQSGQRPGGADPSAEPRAALADEVHREQRQQDHHDH